MAKEPAIYRKIFVRKETGAFESQVESQLITFDDAVDTQLVLRFAPAYRGQFLLSMLIEPTDGPNSVVNILRPESRVDESGSHQPPSPSMPSETHRR